MSVDKIRASQGLLSTKHSKFGTFDGHVSWSSGTAYSDKEAKLRRKGRVLGEDRGQERRRRTRGLIPLFKLCILLDM